MAFCSDWLLSVVVSGRCSWKHQSPQSTVGPFLRDGSTLYMHLYLILLDLVGGLEHFFIFAYIGNNHPNWLFFSEGFKPPTSNSCWCLCIGEEVQAQVQRLSEGLTVISSRKFPKAELRTHPMFCAASSKTYYFFMFKSWSFCLTHVQQCLNTWLGHKRPMMSDCQIW